MYELVGIDPQSQDAYELAKMGPLRPIVKNVPLIYSMRCVEFNNPYFTIGEKKHITSDCENIKYFFCHLEIHACNETEAYLGILVHEIAINLKSVANCIQIRCIRESHFTLDDALVKRHWNVESVLGSLKRCKDIMAKHPEILKPVTPTLEEIRKNDEN